MRLAIAVLAACCVSLAVSDSSAGDTPPKADAGKMLRLALVPEKTYVYRLRETVVERQEIPNEVVAGLAFESRAEIEWDAGVSLQRVEPDGNVVVSLMPTRVRGSFTRPFGKARAFDSDDPNAPARGLFAGLAINVKLSPSGRLLSAEAPKPRMVPFSSSPGSPEFELPEFNEAVVRPFAQMFFQ